MKVSEMNWSQVADWLKHEDLAVLPLGSTEQHAGLSLSVDSILSEKVAVDAAEPLGVPVFPVVSYGLTPYFLAYPGTVSHRIDIYTRPVRDILDSLRGHAAMLWIGQRAFWESDGVYPLAALTVAQLGELLTARAIPHTQTECTLLHTYT